MQNPIRLVVLICTLVALAACYPNAISDTEIAAPRAFPNLPTQWQYVVQTNSANDKIDISKAENDFRKLALAIRRNGKAYEVEYLDQMNSKNKRERRDVFFYAPTQDSSYLIASYSIRTKDGSALHSHIFVYITPGGFDLIPLTSKALTFWRPKNAPERLAKAILLKRHQDEKGPDLRLLGVGDVNAAMIAAQGMPQGFRTSYMLQPNPPAPQSDIDADNNPPESKSTGKWQLGSEKDVITGKTTTYANIRPDKSPAGTTMLIQFRCATGGLQVLLLNKNRPFKDIAPRGEVDIAYVETRWNNSEVLNMVWVITDGYRDQIMDPNGVGAIFQWLIPLIGYGKAKFDWTALWFLNKIVKADELILRVHDVQGGSHTATFSPKISVGHIVKHLPECLK